MAKRLPMDDPVFVTYLRIGYVAAQIIAIAVYYYCQLSARRKNDLTVLKYVNPPSPMVRIDCRTCSCRLMAHGT